jgi:hypothetical protein
LSDPEMQHLSDRALAAELGMSHMTVHRARRRRAALETLTAQVEAFAAASPTQAAATLLEMDPATVRTAHAYRGSTGEALVPRLARLMSDRGLTEAEAKVEVREMLEREAQWGAQERARRKQAAQELKAQRQQWEEQTRRQQEHWQRTRYGQALLQALERFVEACDDEDASMAERVAVLTPRERSTVAELCTQAAAGLEQIRTALQAPRPKASRKPKATREETAAT